MEEEYKEIEKDIVKMAEWMTNNVNTKLPVQLKFKICALAKECVKVVHLRKEEEMLKMSNWTLINMKQANRKPITCSWNKV